MATKELRKLKRINNQLNATANRVNKGLVLEFNNGSKWIEFNGLSCDGRVIYDLEKYTEYLLDTTIELSSVPTFTLLELRDMIRNIGVSREYCVESK